MRIHVVQSGGLAGLRSEHEVETTALDDAERAELERLVREAEFFSLPARKTTGLPDVIQYRLAIESRGRRHEVLFDSESDEALYALIQRVLAVARKRVKR